VTSIFNSIESGGAAIYVRRLVQELAKNHEVFVITALSGSSISNKNETNPKLIQLDSQTQIRVYELLNKKSTILDKSKKLLWIYMGVWNFFAYFEIKKILEKEKPDIIHTNTIKKFSTSIFSAITKLKIPHVHTVHDYELISPWYFLFRNGKPITRFNFLERMYINFKKKTSSNIDSVICPTQITLDLHENEGFFKKSKKFIVSHGLRVDKISPNKQFLNKEFLFLGALLDYKGPQIAIQAFKKVKDNNVKLHIVGHGKYLNTLKKLKGDDIRIIFHGFVKEKDQLNHILENCSFLIFPSIWYETFGFTMIEAMSIGLPVIGSNIGSVPELIKHEYNGFLFEAGNVDSLHSTIEKILQGNLEFSNMSKNALREFSERFSMEKHMKNILEIYDITCRNHNSSKPHFKN